MQELKLSLEQEFSLEDFRFQVQAMSREEAQERLVALYEDIIYREAMYLKLIRDRWGIEPTQGNIQEE